MCYGEDAVREIPCVWVCKGELGEKVDVDGVVDESR